MDESEQTRLTALIQVLIQELIESFHEATYPGPSFSWVYRASTQVGVGGCDLGNIALVYTLYRPSESAVSVSLCVQLLNNTFIEANCHPISETKIFNVGNI